MPVGVRQFEIKTGVIKLLLKFHGLDSESAYLHLKEFEEVCATLHYNNVSEDVEIPIISFFPKENAKARLHSLRAN